MFFLSPNPSPYLVYGMKDATQMMEIPQTLAMKRSVPIVRSYDEYDGIEFTYSFWIYVNDLEYSDNSHYYKHVFHKGSLKENSDGIYEPNNAPGVYLYTGTKQKPAEENIDDHRNTLGLLVRMNVHHNSESSTNPYTYYDDIYVDNIPIKKWVGVIVRLTSQNVVDVYINGTLSKRHRMSNLVKQNYDNVYVNMNGGFFGNLSNLKYYNYAIGTLEIDSITSNGPNLKMSKGNSLETSKPYYLSSNWFYGD